MSSKELIDGEWMKICSRKECDLAGQYQPVTNFHKSSERDGFQTQCKKCRNRYYLKNKVSILKRVNKRYEQKKEEILAYQKDYRSENKPKIAERDKRYAKENRHKINKTMKKYREDPAIKMALYTSTSIRDTIKKTGGHKGGKTFEALPYTPQELREHIENQFDEKMSWDNHGDYWHIDHIIPQAALPYKSLEDENFQKCWDLKNLRPLEAKENIRKGSLYEGERHTYINNKETSNGYEEDT